VSDTGGGFGHGRSAGSAMRVALADYGAGNLRSLASALTRAGADPRVTTDPSVVQRAPLALIAGVGHVESAAAGLARAGLDDALRDRAARGAPTAGICVGLQLLFEESEEGGAGLGLLEGPVRRLRAHRVPHMGWNALESVRESSLLEGAVGEDVYFAHSYAVEPNDRTTVLATVEHDGPVVAAVESGALVGLQFHPERSGPVGATILGNLLRWSRSA
jgi:glutamine amidotransferase